MDIKKNNITFITPKMLQKRKTPKLDYMIYNNFHDLSKYPKLLHTTDEISKLLNSNDTLFYVYMYNNKIAGYVLGKAMVLNDGRQVFFISYIFVAKQFRSKGLGQFLLLYIQQLAITLNLVGIMLVCDTEDQLVYEWYLKNGFMPDLYLRRYEKHDVLYKQI